MAKCQRCPGCRDVRPVRERNRDGSEFVAELCESCRRKWYDVRGEILATAVPRPEWDERHREPQRAEETCDLETLLRIMRTIGL